MRHFKIGADSKKQLEGLNKRCAIFMWDYDKGRLHGIFAGISGGIVETTCKDAHYLYEVKVVSSNQLCKKGMAPPMTAAASWD
jgi:hypothetical protein